MHIPVVKLSEIESTSSHALELLRTSKYKPPFAVLAETQSAGRGRHGREWQSPKGNLYLSIALDPKQISSTSGGLIPLKVAMLCSEWLKKTYCLSISTKWPNDLLVGGKKLGGILCESSLQGETITSLVIGIGLNVNAAPDLSDAAATSLAEILGKTLNVENLAGEFLEFFAKSSPALMANPDIRKSFLKERPITYWTKDSGETLFVDEGIDESGGLILKQLAAPHAEPIVLQSVNHDFRMLYQADVKRKTPLLVVDIGNSRLKLAVF